MKSIIKETYKSKASTSIPARKRSEMEKSPGGNFNQKLDKFKVNFERQIQTAANNSRLGGNSSLNGSKLQIANAVTERLSDFNRQNIIMTPLTPTTGAASPSNNRQRHRSVAGGKQNPFKFGQPIFSDTRTEKLLLDIEKNQEARDAKGGTVDFKHR